MAWDSAAPTKEELKKVNSWDESPPTDDEIGKDSGINWDRIGRNMVDHLPAAGGTIGAGLGGITFPAVGAVPGAAAGAFAGKALENLIERYAYDDGPSREELYLDPMKEAALGATFEAGGQVAGKAIGEGLQAAKKSLPAIGSALSGVPKKVIETYANYAPEVNQMAKEHEGNVASAADEVRSGYVGKMREFRQAASERLGDVLRNSGKTISKNTFINSLEAGKKEIDPSLYPEDIAKINSIINQIKSMEDAPNGLPGSLPVDKANEVVSFLQKHSEYAQPGDIFKVGSEGNYAIKGAARTGRQAISAVEPASAVENDLLSSLHRWEDQAAANLYTPGKPDSALIASGSGANQRGANSLNALGGILGQNVTEDAEKLAAMKYFGNPSFNPAGSPGRSLMTASVGGLAGGAAGYAAGGPGGAAIGAAAGAGMTSPAALKMIMDTSMAVGKKMPGQLTPSLGSMGYMAKEPTVGGYPISQTMPVDVIDQMQAGDNIQKSDLKNVEKGRRLNLLNVHKRVLVSPSGN